MQSSTSLGVGLIFGLLTVLCSFLVQCNRLQDIESLAQVVCVTTKGTKKQITSVHQISELVQFFQSLTGEHKLFPCRNVYLESIKDLGRVLTTANDDACGEEKIKLFENFHRKYVSKVSKHLHKQKRSNKAPKMIKLFFMQYASKISSICEQSAVSFLASYQNPMKAEELTKLDELRKFTDTLGMSDLSDGYKGIYLFWEMIDSLGFVAEKKFAKYLTSGRIRVNIQMKEGGPIRYLKALCRYKLRPAYSKSVLPVLRLVDMGYYPQSERLLANEPKLRSMFLATQVCETLLPVQVFDDEKLSIDQFVALTLDEAAKMVPPEEIVGWKMEEVHVEPESVASLNVLVSSGLAEARASLESVKDNVAARAKVVSRMARIAIKRVKEKVGRLSKTLFKRGANKQLEAIDSEELNKIDEDQIVLVPEDTDDDVLSSQGGRVKRGFWLNLLIAVGMVVWCIYFIILTIIKVAILGIPSLIAFIINSETLQKPLTWLWRFGFDPTAPIPNGFIEDMRH